MAETIMSVAMGALTIAFGIFCGVMAMSMLLRRMLNWRLARRSRNWPKTAGMIVAAKVEQVGRMRWAPKISYEYGVNGSMFKGSRLAFDHDKSYAASEANKIAESHAVGSRVDVFYDPNQPSECTLRKIHLDASHELLFVCIVLLVPTVFCSSIGVIGLVQTWSR